ncbi:hypothetical protein DD606_26280, partial [Enterobacter cloacae complex sp. GF14B]
SEDTLTQIMQETWIRGDLHQAMSLHWLEVPYHGDLDYKIVLRSLLQKLSMLQQMRHAKKLFGLVDWLQTWESMQICQSYIVIVKVLYNWQRIQCSIRRLSILM